MNNQPMSIAPLLKRPCQSFDYSPNRWGWIENQDGQRAQPLPSRVKFENGHVINFVSPRRYQPIKNFFRWFARLMGLSA